LAGDAAHRPRARQRRAGHSPARGIRSA
jgi:hypothetical protein